MCVWTSTIAPSFTTAPRRFGPGGRRLGDEPAAANCRAHDHGGGDQHQVLDDVLAFERRDDRKDLERLLREEEQRRERPDHVDREKEQDHAHSRGSR
jgi:hypothetical protein